MNSLSRHLLLALGSLLLAATAAQAQYEQKVVTLNSIFVAQTQNGAADTPSGPPPDVSNPALTTPGQFASMGLVAGSSGPITLSADHADRYPSTPDNVVVQVRLTLGSPFASGVPRYSMGEIIKPPLVQVDGVTPAPADSGYWRAKPVLPGESLPSVALPVTVISSSTSSTTVTVAAVPSSLVNGVTLLGKTVNAILGTTITLAGNANQTITAATEASYVPPGEVTLFALTPVDVTLAALDKTTVNVKTVPDALQVGAILLGQPVTKIDGTGPAVVTLAGNANANITSENGDEQYITPATSYYYSPHAERVLASQPGRVEITWVTSAPISGSAYGIKSETFAVSSTTLLPVRSIFWTEGSFDGPVVRVTDARITTVSPVFYSSVPKAVPEEVEIPGYNPIAPRLTTLSYEKFNGAGQLKAYNVEGRVLVEYLGNVRLGGNIYESVGFDLVEIKRVPDVGYKTTQLGSEIRPHEEAPAGEPYYQASPLLATSQNGDSYYGTSARPDGTLVYYAERETSTANDPDDGMPSSTDAYNKVVFYWLQEGAFSIQWPKFQDRYWQRWSPNLDDYAHYTVASTGSTPETGIPLSGGQLPQIVYQDDATQTEAQIDLATQRFHVTFAAGADHRNRSLLKFNGSSSADLWYVNIYTQAEDRERVLSSTSSTTGQTVVTVASTAGLAPGMTVTGPGITGTATIVSITDATRLVLSQIIANATAEFSYNNLVRTSTSSRTVVTHSVTPTDVYEGDEVRSQDGLFRGTILKLVDSAHFIISRNSLSPFEYISDATRLFDDYYPNGSVWKTNWSLTTSNLAPNSVTVNTTSGLAAGMTVTGPGISGSATIVSITDGTHFVLSQSIPDATNNLTYSTVLTSTSLTIAPTIVTVDSTAGLEVGMVVTGPGINGAMRIARIISATQFKLSENIADATANLTYTVQADALAPIDTTATVGVRLTPPAGHELAGYISAGTGYYPAGYLNPFAVGVEPAAAGAIIPVNALPTNKVLTVRWFKKVAAPSAQFQDLYVPGKVGRYTVSYPAASDQIVIAQGIGTGNLAPAEAAGSIYSQNIPALPGYNPNEEHAPSILAGRAYALREDLNVTSGSGYTSEPFLLLAYTDPADDRPAIHAYKVLREIDANNDRIKDPGDILFDYNSTAGTLLVKPYPLPLLPLPLVGTGVNRTSKDIEIIGADDPANTAVNSDPAYKGFTFKDRKGFTWIHRGPHSGGTPGVRSSTSDGSATITVDSTAGLAVGMSVSGPGITAPATIVSIDMDTYHYVLSQTVAAGTNAITYGPTLTMKLYYTSQTGFFVPGLGEPAVGTVLPFLRDASRSGQTLSLTAIDNGQPDAPLPIIYRPVWPTDAPELQVAETLTLEKFGLPQVRGQKSAEVYYQQSIAKDETNTLTRNSVTLHDPTRKKTVKLDAAGVGLDKLPTAIKTTSYRGKTYFQGLPPHLQKRLYLDPLDGTLVLIGEFHDELAGEDYLDLNLLTDVEEKAIKNLVPTPDGQSPETGSDDAKWDKAIEALNTRVETFKPDPAQFGSYIVDHTKDADRGENDLSPVSSSDTAVDSYAITATGQGTGFVTMVFGNGRSFTPEGDPVQVKIFQVAEQLYVGDLKVLLSSNPLDEQVTLRHSGDFAGKPEDYDFEWRWSTGEASAPATYATLMTKRIGDSTTNNWLVVSDPGALKPTDAQYTSAAPALPLPRTENVHPVDYVLDAQNQPTTTIIEATSYTDAEIAAGYPSLVLKSASGVDFTGGVPGSIVFSAKTGSFDGFVLYVNNKVALAHNAPTPQFTLTNASSKLTATGKADETLKQFSLAPSYFKPGPNIIEVAIYTTADPNAQSNLDFILEAAQETDLVVTAGTKWQVPAAGDTNMAIVGGSPANPFGGPQFVLNDRWFTMRYKTKSGANNVLGDGVYSRWMPPQFVEGWVKRVLAAINPFEQRVKDMYNNQISTDVSVLTQAGTRWEGDIALTMDNIEDVGLIAIYETVLNRAKTMSIDANTNDPDTNNALILAAGYLNDLYTLLGNEAFADAANPTISIDDQTTITEVNTSRFSFEAQVASSLDEELALLRGRNDLVSPGVITGPAYNRLYWNYTHGINSGEVLYAVNYNIKEKVGSSTANGVIDEADAQRMFPQGHGDAYGHYLTALTGYYRLLSNSNFDWKARAEAVTVAGQPVTVDFQDERKFAAAAGNVARTAEQVVSLVFRQSYKDDPALGWESLHDSTPTNTQTGVTSAQGLDEWISRSAQGALFHWAVANAMVPDEDTYHTGVEKIDRSTVLEIPQLATAVAGFQTTIDNANAHLNPLGLSPGAIAFDISPTEMKAGKSHFEQVYERSLRALNNAAGAFNQAGRMTRSLRNQQNQIDDYATTIAQQESAYVNQLIDIYGRPYSGDIGPGKLYAQGYEGPDIFHWFIVDRQFDDRTTLTGSKSLSIAIYEPIDLDLTGIQLPESVASNDDPMSDLGFTWPAAAEKTVNIAPSQLVQYNDVWKEGGLGARRETGQLQSALSDAQQTFLALSEAQGTLLKDTNTAKNKLLVLQRFVESERLAREEVSDSAVGIASLRLVEAGLKGLEGFLTKRAGDAVYLGQIWAEGFPTSFGLANDATSAARAASMTLGFGTSKLFRTGSTVAGIGAAVAGASADKLASDVADELANLQFRQEVIQLAYEFDVVYQEVITHTSEIAQLALAHQRALENVNNVIAKGLRILADREIFRQRAAAIVQGYRTKDLTFRLFRNEALEQYRTLFDLASRYSYLAAKSYDYETGLLGSSEGRKIFDKLVASRSLGDLTGGVPQSTTSTLGDSGLAGTMAQLSADFSVAEGRLGINNPDQYGTVFSMRQELYRLLNDPTKTADDDAWRQTLEQHIVANLLADSDIATQCRNIAKPDGTPVPGIVIPFSTTIQSGKNFFGLPLAAGDHNFTPGNFATKIYNVGISLPGYVGMDTYAAGNPYGAPASGDPNALSATPYVYLIPCGNDYMLAPPLGDTNTLRSWKVDDQALPLPYNLGAADFNSTQFFNANGTLSEQPWILRKHQPFRPVENPTFFYSLVPAEFTNSRLIGRSAWNGQWKLVIPAITLLQDEQLGLNNFVQSVKDIQLFLRTYSHSGN